MPELRLNLDILEANAQIMADAVASMGKDWRPHIKSHNEPRLAHLLIKRGAIGVTAARIQEVTRMADAGVPSVLFAHIAVRESDRKQLAIAARKTHLLVCVDHYAQAELYSRTAVEEGVSFSVLIDIDIGMNRTGCRPGMDATQLARGIDGLPRLEVAGIFGYEGHLLTIEDAQTKQSKITDALNTLRYSRDAIVKSGIPCPVVSAGASGSLSISGRHPAITEIQAGGGIFGDPFYQRLGLAGIRPALHVVADVVSRPSLERVVLNAGRKSINPFVEPPTVVDFPDARIAHMSAEHTVLQVDASGRDLRIGDEVRLSVGYSDHSLLMHREIIVVRGDHREDTWSVLR